ncbi:MAG: hypothetical protein AAGB12_16830, partial [Pseudomonadota bacterium]
SQPNCKSASRNVDFPKKKSASRAKNFYTRNMSLSLLKSQYEINDLRARGVGCASNGIILTNNAMSATLTRLFGGEDQDWSHIAATSVGQSLGNGIVQGLSRPTTSTYTNKEAQDIADSFILSNEALANKKFSEYLLAGGDSHFANPYPASSRGYVFNEQELESILGFKKTSLDFNDKELLTRMAEQLMTLDQSQPLDIYEIDDNSSLKNIRATDTFLGRRVSRVSLYDDGTGGEIFLEPSATTEINFIKNRISELEETLELLTDIRNNYDTQHELRQNDPFLLYGAEVGLSGKGSLDYRYKLTNHGDMTMGTLGPLRFDDQGGVQGSYGKFKVKDGVGPNETAPFAIDAGPVSFEPGTSKVLLSLGVDGPVIAKGEVGINLLEPVKRYAEPLRQNALGFKTLRDVSAEIDFTRGQLNRIKAQINNYKPQFNELLIHYKY